MNAGFDRSQKHQDGGEKETTTGWQFATQIEDDGEETLPSKFDIVGGVREQNNRSALLIENREVFPSMLDPAFEDDAPSPKIKATERELAVNSSRTHGIVAKPPMQDGTNSRLAIARFTQGYG